MSLVDDTDALAARIAEVLNDKADLDGSGRVPLSQATIHTHNADAISEGTLDGARFPRVFFGGYGAGTLTSGSMAWNPDTETFLRLFTLTVTGNPTINAPGGTPLDGEVQKFHFYASGGARTITFDPAYRLSTGITSRAFTVPSGQVLFLAVEYSDFIDAWTIVAATVSAP